MDVGHEDLDLILRGDFLEEFAKELPRPLKYIADEIGIGEVAIRNIIAGRYVAKTDGTTRYKSTPMPTLRIDVQQKVRAWVEWKRACPNHGG